MEPRLTEIRGPALLTGAGVLWVRVRSATHATEGANVKELDAAEKSALIAQVDFFKGCTQREPPMTPVGVEISSPRARASHAPSR
jgi:hypothetical protein